MTICLVGEDNPQSCDPSHALHNYPRGCAGERLQRVILGLAPERYLALPRTNLCNPTWDVGEARERARLLLTAAASRGAFVLLGRKVADAFGRALDRELRAWHHYAGPHGSRVVCLPHPSGRCHVWNERDSVARARRLLHHVAPEVPWGEIDHGLAAVA